MSSATPAQNPSGSRSERVYAISYSLFIDDLRPGKVSVPGERRKSRLAGRLDGPPRGR